MVRKFLGQDFLDFDDLEMLHRVFDAICVELDKTSVFADDDARLVVSVFQAGFKDEKVLLAEVRRRKESSNPSG